VTTKAIQQSQLHTYMKQIMIKLWFLICAAVKCKTLIV